MANERDDDQTDLLKEPPQEESGPTRREFVVGVGTAAAGAALLTSGTASADAGTPIYRIHPAFGFARHGNADPSTFFIGPEIPGMPPLGDAPGTQVPPYKADQATLVKPQGVRFRIFQYTLQNGRLTPGGEVTLDTPGVANIQWKVHVANKKSSFFEDNGPAGESQPAGPLRNPSVTNRASLNSDFGERCISGRSQSGVEFRYGTSANPSQESVVIGADGVTPLIDYLGQLRTDGCGRLIFIGGNGHSGSNQSPPASISHWANNNGWFDSSSDGPVTATVTLSDGRVVQMDPGGGNAWVFSGPPDFAPRIGSATSLYDVLYDMGVRNLAIPANNALYDDGGPLERLRKLQAAFQATGDVEFPGFLPDYPTEIQPILEIGYRYRWVTGLVNFKHSSLIDPALADPSSAAAAARSGVFVFMRPPGDAVDWGGPRSMPNLYGDDYYHGSLNAHFSFPNNGPGTGTGSSTFQTPQKIQNWARYATLTRTQYGLLKNWALGNFVPPPGNGTPAPSITPHGLDRAALENCVGGPFFPGIEAPWQIRNPKLFVEPFRLDPNATSQYILPDGTVEGGPLQPGHFSRQMAVPWQADFMDCSKLLNLGWWPSQRPDDVFLASTDTLKDRVPWARFDDSNFSFANAEPGHLLMIKHWNQFGFVIEQWGGAFVETERDSFIDSVLP
jgi:hypothetical protein